MRTVADHRSSSIACLRTAILAAALALAACGDAPPPQSSSELNWARAALERNPQLKVLSSDPAKNTIQVRVKATGEVLTVTPGELAAIPIADLVALAAPTPAPVSVESPPSPAAAIAPEPEPPSEPTPAFKPAPEYIVERADGRVRVSGPGVSIESHPAAAPTDAEQKFDEPFVCDGKRLVHLDNKKLRVAGDAITLNGGCELHITNSRIVAGGAAVTVLMGTVHIANSEIVGEQGSLVLSSVARAVLRNSQFTGLSRRDPQAAVVDQGGNSWR